MEFVMIRQKGGTVKRLPIPNDVVNASADRSAVLDYVKNPPAEALASAETIYPPAPAAASEE